MSLADGELVSIALCWRLERADGAGIALTSHDMTIVGNGVTFQPAPGIVPSSVTRSLGLEPDAGEVAGALTSAALTDHDLLLGRWDGATMQLTAVDWNDPAEETIRLLGGSIGTVAIDGTNFKTDLQGAAVKLEEPVCPATSAECRARFGDKQCRVDLAGRTATASVIGVDGTSLMLDHSLDDRFVLGRFRLLSGPSCGWTSVILSVEGAAIQIRDMPRIAIETPCRVELREGCDKRFETCVSRFANAANFRGEPHLPGNDLLTRYPGA